MTEHEQLQRVCQWNRELVRANSHLKEELRHVVHESSALREANANLRVERDATDELLGAAMDEALRAKRL